MLLLRTLASLTRPYKANKPEIRTVAFEHDVLVVEYIIDNDITLECVQIVIMYMSRCQPCCSTEIKFPGDKLDEISCVFFFLHRALNRATTTKYL